MTDTRLLRKIADTAMAPAGWALHAAGRFRAEWYADPSRRTRLRAPCLSVGNITFGGTGKTPLTMFLARECMSLGFKPAILLRGYGRKSRGARSVTPESTWESVGDEALVLQANLPGVPILVGERRDEAASLAPGETDLFILDDGFQHLRVHRDLDVVLVDVSRLGDLSPPPRGRLREPLEAIQRAHLMVLTHGGVSELPPSLALHWAGRPRVGASFRWEPTLSPGGIPWRDLGDSPCAAFSGIGNPVPFFRQAREAGLRLASETIFPDHAEPTSARRDAALRAAKSAGASWVLCTEKDHVKWSPVWPKDAPPLRYPRLSVTIDDPGDCLRPLLLSLKKSRDAG